MASTIGRPRKFGRPSRAVTVTLPEDVLGRLTTINTDVGTAIVNLVERRTSSRIQPVAPAEITRYGKHAVIVVTPVRALRRLKGVQLVPIGDGRALISLDSSHSVSGLELQLRDALENGGKDTNATSSKSSPTFCVARGARAYRGSKREASSCSRLNSRRLQQYRARFRRSACPENRPDPLAQWHSRS